MATPHNSDGASAPPELCVIALILARRFSERRAKIFPGTFKYLTKLTICAIISITEQMFGYGD